MRGAPLAYEPADLSAFHEHLKHANDRRVVPVCAGLAVLFGFTLVESVLSGSTGYDLQNLAGLLTVAIIVAVNRWSNVPGASSVLLGYLTLAWGDSVLVFNHYPLLRMPMTAPLAVNLGISLTLYFVTRFLAAVIITWQPRQLVFALAVNQVAVFGPELIFEGTSFRFINGLTWTAAAWIPALMVYRAERDAFMARRVLQAQRDTLAKANAQLEQLNQEKNDLMAVAAHDLRSPLMGMTTLLKMTADETARTGTTDLGALRAVEQSGHDLASLVTRVLDAHQTEARFETLSIARGDIAAVVGMTMESLRVVAQAKGIALDVRADGPCLALHDPQALGRVIENLASNAIKFSPSGGAVRVSVAPAAGGGARIEVADSGPGIADEDRPRLFRKFARLRAKPTAGESSSGLGLYIVKRLIVAMGGSVDVKNAPGGGAVFTVTLAPQIP